MNATPQIVPITEMRKSHPDVLDLLPNGPVYLAQRSRPAAVLLSTKQWDRLNEQIEDMAALIDYLEVKLSLAEGKTQVEETTIYALKAELDAVSASV
jgi:PHD/YefM family antitoxin component YafN of YafNO toxin-antitoxin module